MNARMLAREIKSGVYDKEDKLVFPIAMKHDIMNMLNELNKRRKHMSEPRKVVGFRSAKV